MIAPRAIELGAAAVDGSGYFFPGPDLHFDPGARIGLEVEV
jgi:hypothetical protein